MSLARRQHRLQKTNLQSMFSQQSLKNMLRLCLLQQRGMNAFTNKATNIYLRKSQTPLPLHVLILLDISSSQSQRRHLQTILSQMLHFDYYYSLLGMS